jgi:broad specificity phosphatase PhoE
MLSVYLLRHGETAYNAAGNRYCGRTDINLTDKGIIQAKQVNERLHGVQVDAVYSSPLERARHTAEIATGRQVQTDERIIEVDFGDWEGKTQAEFMISDPGTWEAWMQDPLSAKAGATGETGQQVVDRVDAFFSEMLSKHSSQTIVVVAHNGVNRLYIAYKLGMPLKNYRRILQENSAVTYFELDDEGIMTLKRLNA